MKKTLFLLAFLLSLGLLAFVGYKYYLPHVVAKAVTSNDEHIFLPEDVKLKINKIKEPVNNKAAEVIKTIHKSGLTLQQILDAIDDIEEEQALAFLDELNNTELKSTDQIFNIAKKHFPVDFDVEVLRKPFSEKVKLRTIEKAITRGNKLRETNEVDFETLKSIAKKILLQKEEEFNKAIKRD